MELPQPGACLCGEVGYRLVGQPLTLYACHCTDCQTQTGAAFSLALIVRDGAVETVRGSPQSFAVATADGRSKDAHQCPRCRTRLWGASTAPGLTLLEAGTLDDTSWLHPAGHIWTRSAQPWIRIPEDSLRFERQPEPDDWLAMVRAWRDRQTG